MTREDYADHIAKIMKERRAALDLSLQQVADRSGLTKSHIWEMENGKARNPTLSAMVSISRALGVSLDYLTGLSNSIPDLHPEALRIAVEVDALLRRNIGPIGEIMPIYAMREPTQDAEQTGVMRISRKAAERVEKWSPAKQALARRVSGAAPNDNSKAVGDFTRVLKDQGMIDQDGNLRRD